MGKGVNMTKLERDQMNLFVNRPADVARALPVYEAELLAFMEGYYGSLPVDVSASLVFLSLFVRAGHVALPLDRRVGEWREMLELDRAIWPDLEQISREQLAEHSITGGEGEQESSPLVLKGNRLFFRIHYRQEVELAAGLNRLAASRFEPPVEGDWPKRLAEQFPSSDDGEVNWQRVAAAVALGSRLLVLSGGPGTGKTTTVARILQLLEPKEGDSLSVALAAPTGKAAARMNQVLTDQLADRFGQIPSSFRIWSGTLHRLLSDRDRPEMLPPVWPEPLSWDLIIVDEASMVDLTMMSRLVYHIGSRTRLILLGDHHQLSSVEAGAVLSAICRKEENRFSPNVSASLSKATGYKTFQTESQSDLEDVTVYLEKGYRFDASSGIGRLAASLRAGQPDRIREVLTQQWPDLSVQPFNRDKRSLERLAEGFRQRYLEALTREENELYDFWNHEIWLTLPRKGDYGSEQLNRFVESWLERVEGVRRRGGWYHGRPVLISRNDYSLGVYNGDFGVCIEHRPGQFDLLLKQPDGHFRRIPVDRIPESEPACFLTVHKSQGSEYDRVHLLLPAEPIPLLTRELVYTAITRARNHCNLYGDPALLSIASDRRSERFTGLEAALFQR